MYYNYTSINPNFRKGQDFFTKNNQKIHFINQNWEKYDSLYQKYLYIAMYSYVSDTTPQMMDHYRAHQLALRTWLVPQLQKVERLEFLT
ncbi:hypothetical protein Avbf_11537 [Armadillidium vulgare]|nr:hypothetical protein Avbf_11537 [Armadillidium vulgare]